MLTGANHTTVSRCRHYDSDQKWFIVTNGHRGSVQYSERFVFCLQQQTVCALNDHRSANGHVPLIYSDSSLIAHSLGDIQCFCVIKKTLWAPPFLFAIHSKSRANGANVQQNVRCTEWTKLLPPPWSFLRACFQ